MPILSVNLGSVGTQAKLAVALGVPVPAINAVSLEKTACRRAQWHSQFSPPGHLEDVTLMPASPPSSDFPPSAVSHFDFSSIWS